MRPARHAPPAPLCHPKDITRPPMRVTLPVHDRTQERRRTEPRWLRPSIVRDISVFGALPAMD